MVAVLARALYNVYILIYGHKEETDNYKIQESFLSSVY